MGARLGAAGRGFHPSGGIARSRVSEGTTRDMGETDCGRAHRSGRPSLCVGTRVSGRRQFAERRGLQCLKRAPVVAGDRIAIGPALRRGLMHSNTKRVEVAGESGRAVGLNNLLMRSHEQKP